MKVVDHFLKSGTESCLVVNLKPLSGFIGFMS